MTSTPLRRLLAPTVVLLTLLAAAAASAATVHGQTSVLSSLGALPAGGGARPSAPRALIVPVQGVDPSELRDTFREARSGGRVHDAIDIHAPRGTPVLAAADGVILRLHEGARGGLSIYQLDADGRTRYYYAHLDGYAEGIAPGREVRQGDVIGYVGDTGNAQPGDHHLHFSVAVLSDRSRWWEGRNLNPFELLPRR